MAHQVQYSRPIILITLTLFCVSVHGNVETIHNPGQSKHVYCPSNNDCTIICDETESCKYSKFHLNSHSVRIECSAPSACSYVSIYGSSVASLDIIANGEYAAQYAKLYSYSTDSNINVECSGTNGCKHAQFHYMNQGTLSMSCTGDWACHAAIIHSMVPLSLHCGIGQNSCYRSSVILPTDEVLNNQSVITLSGNDYASTNMPIIVKSLYDFRNVICVDGCIADKIYIVYGIQFDYYCKVSNTACMNAANAHLTNTDTLTIINTYSVSPPTSLDFSASAFNGSVLVIHPKGSQLTFVPPMIDDTSWLSVLCVWCDYLIFQLGSIQNTVVTVAGHFGLAYTTIYAPQNHFKINSYHWANSNAFYLENADKITLNSLVANGDVYLGNNADVTINCRSTDSPLFGCSKTELWSSLTTSQVWVGDGFWNIDCPTNDGCSDYFYIRFDSEQYLCTYHDDVSNCSFLCPPTKSPTEKPTQAPTPYPTQYPTRSPVTNTPTRFPSNPPTSAPTRFPTIAPTPLCYSMSVEVGITNGAFNTAEFEGLFTMNPIPFFNRPWWVMPQSPGRYIKYVGASWYINSIGGDALIFTSNDDFPPINNAQQMWQHSTTQGYFAVFLTCVDSYSPTILTTLTPTLYPTNLPTNDPSVGPSQDTSSVNPTPHKQTAVYTQTLYDDSRSGLGNPQHDEYVDFLIITSSIVSMIVCLGCLYMCWRKKQHERYSNEKSAIMENNMEITHAVETKNDNAKTEIDGNDDHDSRSEGVKQDWNTDMVTSGMALTTQGRESNTTGIGNPNIADDAFIVQ